MATQATVLGLLVPVDEVARFMHLPFVGDSIPLAEVQRLVGGYVQEIRPVDRRFGAWVGLVDEDGIPVQREENLVATRMAVMGGWRTPGQIIRGDVLFVGDAPNGWNEVPTTFRSQIERYYHPLDARKGNA